MSAFQGIQPDPSMIGRLVKPAFCLVPDPAPLFAARAARFRALAPGHDLAPYLSFLAGLCEAQAALAAALPPLAPPPAGQLQRARDNTMPPLDRAGIAEDPVLAETARRFLDAIGDLDMPAPAAAALDDLRRSDGAELKRMLANVLADAMPAETLPQHLFLAAAVQLHMARAAATLDAKALLPLAPGVCPVCGGPPVASMVVGRQGAEGARYAACACCNSQWNEVRIKCLACGSTKGVGYQSPEGEEMPVVKAECCDSCQSWVKIFYQDKNPSLETVADDVASLGLDLMMQPTKYRRAGFDPFLVGY
ncbi:formate dehydrogenase accessory protein FdhE [Pseudoroseomonas deserti]|uniref:Protein FdhE homolog n=1 Tax=Teichococcus deserti TaxID=1817963 RepID=A0A1V2H3I0_9PROT|nr:formate dehydrogenase accessory protein FdhE [Pseudoroseomonas deserti]ONG54277.1 formate dehydrogenase accessory protein FdhE [Pseudoroseomonas deserti]